MHFLMRAFLPACSACNVNKILCAILLIFLINSQAKGEKKLYIAISTDEEEVQAIASSMFLSHCIIYALFASCSLESSSTPKCTFCLSLARHIIFLT